MWPDPVGFRSQRAEFRASAAIIATVRLIGAKREDGRVALLLLQPSTSDRVAVV